ncbi:MAG: 2-dehydropantoate 2-reductase [Opitutales bacterium]
MQHLAIIGPGAIGGTVAAWLNETGRYRITVCGRRPLAEITVETKQRELRFQPQIVLEPAMAPSVDWVFVATKAYDAPSAARWLPALTRNGAPVAVLQNGVEHMDRFVAVVPAERIVPVVVNLPCERRAADRIWQRAGGRLTVPDGPLGREFVAFFADTPIMAGVTADFKSAAWRKLCLNAVGILSALTRRPAGVMREEAMAGLGRAIAQECIAVGRAEGAVLEDGLADEVVRDYQAAPPDAVNSLHADREAGRPMEIEARNGVIVRRGEKHGISTPCNRMAVALLEALGRAEHTGRPEGSNSAGGMHC